jgi:hypothetical protein
LTELLYAQSDANFAVWNEAVDHPIDVRLEGSTLSKALQKLTKDHSLAVRRGSHGNSLVFLSPALDIPLQQPTPQESTVARSTATLVIPSRQEPPADPTLAPAASNNSAQ